MWTPLKNHHETCSSCQLAAYFVYVCAQFIPLADNRMHACGLHLLGTVLQSYSLQIDACIRSLSCAYTTACIHEYTYKNCTAKHVQWGHIQVNTMLFSISHACSRHIITAYSSIQSTITYRCMWTPKYETPFFFIALLFYYPLSLLLFLGSIKVHNTQCVPS